MRKFVKFQLPSKNFIKILKIFKKNFLLVIVSNEVDHNALFKSNALKFLENRRVTNWLSIDKNIINLEQFLLILFINS